MADKDPILLIQMQRMGDIILTFPLMVALKRRWPGHPVWVVAEPSFFRELMPLAPEAVFFPPEMLPNLAWNKFLLVINLSGRAGAADFLGGLAPEKTGWRLGAETAGSARHIHGFWHLYRAALTQNNHGNLFHWSDLYRLDIEDARPARMGLVIPAHKKSRSVAMVLGASEAAKHPDAIFWSRLATRLRSAGWQPFFIGGKAEMALGQETARLARMPQANFCGRLSLGELAKVLRSVALCITPDTGPMHLANWLGTPVLNLSLGPVNAQETGPVSPGHWIIRAAMSCTGCWRCPGSRIRCHQHFSPAAVAEVALALLEQTRPTGQPGPACPKGLQLLRTARDSLGLYSLVRQGDHEVQNARRCLARAGISLFWQAAFLLFASLDRQDGPVLPGGGSGQCQGKVTAERDPGCAAGNGPDDRPDNVLSARPGNSQEPADSSLSASVEYAAMATSRLRGLQSGLPALVEAMGHGLARIGLDCARAMRRGQPLTDSFWQARPPLLRLFAGHCHLELENSSYSPTAWQKVLARIDHLRDLVASL